MEIPDFFIKKLKEQYNENEVEKIKEGLQKRRNVTFRINTLKTNKEEIQTVLKQEKIEYDEVIWNKDAIILKNVTEQDIKKLEIYNEGKIYLQSLSSMLPVIILQPNEKENILDMTAAPGGKTTQIAAYTKNKAFITATEKNKIRLQRLEYNVKKQGVKNINIMQEDSRKLSDYFSFDRILLDAPCSGSGTENVFSEKFTEELINRSIKTQEELLVKALRILKSGGEMVYSTCSILKDENENVLKNVLKKFNAEIVPIEKIENIPCLPVIIDGTLCVCPSNLYEGFFVAKIRKK